MSESALEELSDIANQAIEFLRDTPGASTDALTAALDESPQDIGLLLQDALRAGAIERVEVRGVWRWNVGTQADYVMSTATGEEAREVVKVSAMASPSIFAYADQRGAAPFSCALSTDGRMAIQRHGRLLLELTNSERQILLRVAGDGIKPHPA